MKESEQLVSITWYVYTIAIIFFVLISLEEMGYIEVANKRTVWNFLIPTGFFATSLLAGICARLCQHEERRFARAFGFEPPLHGYSEEFLAQKRQTLQRVEGVLQHLEMGWGQLEARMYARTVPAFKETAQLARRFNCLPSYFLSSVDW